MIKKNSIFSMQPNWLKTYKSMKNFRFFFIFLENHNVSEQTIFSGNDRLIKGYNHAEFQKKILTVPTLVITKDVRNEKGLGMGIKSRALIGLH